MTAAGIATAYACLYRACCYAPPFRQAPEAVSEVNMMDGSVVELEYSKPAVVSLRCTWAGRSQQDEEERTRRLGDGKLQQECIYGVSIRKTARAFAVRTSDKTDKPLRCSDGGRVSAVHGVNFTLFLLILTSPCLL